MRFLDADVRRPLRAVCAIVDGGNTVVFSAAGSKIVNDSTGDEIHLARKGGVYVMTLEVDEIRGGGSESDEGRVVGGVGVSDEGEHRGSRCGEGLVFMNRLNEEGMGVFRRQA